MCAWWILSRCFKEKVKIAIIENRWVSRNTESMILVVLCEFLTTTKQTGCRGPRAVGQPSESHLVPIHTDHLVLVKGQQVLLIVALRCF